MREISKEKTLMNLNKIILLCFRYASGFVLTVDKSQFLKLHLF